MNENVRILFAGDIALGGEFAALASADPSYWVEPFLELEPVFQAVDLRIGNLESPLSHDSDICRKRNVLGAPSCSVRALSALNFSALCLANNHITDQGPGGLIKTREILASKKIHYFGAGENIAAAARPAVIHVKGLSFAFLGYASEPPDVGSMAATGSTPGCAPLSLDRIAMDIASIRGRVSHIVVSLHWGYQYDLYPEPQQIELAHRIIDLGALVVYGHHPHVVQGIESYRKGVILYSLGNFFVPDFKRSDGCWYRFPKESRRTAVAQCEIGAEGLRAASMIPLRVNADYKVVRPTGKDADNDAASLAERSATLKMQPADFAIFWSRHHESTKARRARSELKLLLCGGIKTTWNQFRTLGFLAVLRGIKKKRLSDFIRQLRRHI